MRDRFESLLKLACLALVALLVFQLVRVAARKDPLAKLSIPAVPTYVAPDEALSGKGTNSPSATAKTGTNVLSHGAAIKDTNAAPERQAGKVGSNSVAVSKAASETNAMASNLTPGKNGTNIATQDSTEAGTQLLAKLETVQKSGTNFGLPQLTNPPGTSALASRKAPDKSGTNQALVEEPLRAGSNAVTRLELSKGGTNSSPRPEVAGKGPSSPSRASAGPNMPSHPGMAPKLPDLPPEILARVDRVYDSELFGPVFHPMPIALLGIAGNVAFLRTPNGQTGLVKEGDELGGLKLLRIGINRVLVQEKEDKKELMIFNGLGGESLLPK